MIELNYELSKTTNNWILCGMKGIIKRTIIFILVIGLLLIVLFAFSAREKVVYDINQIKEEFSQYSNDKNVFLESDGYLTFTDYSLDLNKLVSKKEKIQSAGIVNEKLVFSTVKAAYEESCLDCIGAVESCYSLIIYQCDTQGENLEQLFIKENYQNSPDTRIENNMCYIRYSASSILNAKTIIEAYDFVLNEYINTCNVTEADIFYELDYEQDNKSEKGSLIIKALRTNKSIIINEEKLRNTICYQDLMKYSYTIGYMKEYNGRKYIPCILEVTTGGWDWCGKYVYFIFELDFESQQLSYKTFIYTTTTDIESYYIKG